MTEFSFSHVNKNFGFKPVLKDLSFEVMTGERAALIGRNGTGKSTILKLLAGEESPDSGEISLRRGANTALLEQIPRLRGKDATVYDVLCEPFAEVFSVEAKLRELEEKMTEDFERYADAYTEAQSRYAALGGYDAETRLKNIVQGFKLNDLLERPYNVLSGGQKTVVNLAAVVLREPDILLLDEPTNHLDMQTLDWFEGFLAKYRGTVLMVSHDRRFLDRVATRTLILEDGICTSYPGGYTAAKEEQERQMLLEFEQYKNQQKQIEAMKAAIKRFREWGAQADNPKFFRRAKMLELRLEKMEMIKRPQLEKPKIPMRFAGDRTGREVLQLTGFSLSFGKTALFEQAELLVEEKDRMAFLGANGTGKTSLLRAIFGDVPFSGTAKFNPSAQLGYIPQEIRFLNDKDSVLEAFRRECVCGEGEARQILAKYYFCGAAVMKRVSSLSGGEKVLLKLAVLLQNRVNFLILDEPTNHIDIETREMLEDALLEFSGTLLFISHDRYFIDKLATKIAVLENRKINVFDGTYADYLRVTGHA